MTSTCKLCNNLFIDSTKKQNKVYCYDSDCIKERNRLYRKSTANASFN